MKINDFFIFKLIIYLIKNKINIIYIIIHFYLHFI